MALILFFFYIKSWLLFSCKWSDRNVWSFVEHTISIANTQICHCSMRGITQHINEAVWLCSNKTLFLKKFHCYHELSKHLITEILMLLWNISMQFVVLSTWVLEIKTGLDLENDCKVSDIVKIRAYLTFFLKNLKPLLASHF